MTLIFDTTLPEEVKNAALKNLERFNTKSKVQIVALYKGVNYAIKIGRNIYSTGQTDMEEYQWELDFLKENGFDTAFAQSQIDNKRL